MRVMALLRSDILNKKLLEEALSTHEGKKVVVETITMGVGQVTLKLEEKIEVTITAKVRNKEKVYHLVAKLLQAEKQAHDQVNFYGYLETEVDFYKRLVPQLKETMRESINDGRSKDVHFHELIYGDSHTPGREVLLLTDLTKTNEDKFESANSKVVGSKEGLGFGHVIRVVEWMARFHGHSFHLLQSHRDGPGGFLDDHPSVHKSQEDSLQRTVLFGDETDGVVRERLQRLVGHRRRRREEDVGLKDMDKNNDEDEDRERDARLEELLRHQDWLHEVRKAIQNKLKHSRSSSSSSSSSRLRTLVHGELWFGCVLFQHKLVRNPSEYVPLEAVVGDFHACACGHPGRDLAHFLITSTSRAFRERFLDNVLSAYLQELQEVLKSHGYDGHSLYNVSQLRDDYKEGLLSGIAFCLFALVDLPQSTRIGLDYRAELGNVANMDETDGGNVRDEILLANVAEERILEAIEDVLDLQS